MKVKAALLLEIELVMAGGPLTRRNFIPSSSTAVFHSILLVHSSFLEEKKKWDGMELKKVNEEGAEGEKEMSLVELKTHNHSRRPPQSGKRRQQTIQFLFHSAPQERKRNFIFVEE